MKTCTYYCENDLYNNKIILDNNLLKRNTMNVNEEPAPILACEVRNAIQERQIAISWKHYKWTSKTRRIRNNKDVQIIMSANIEIYKMVRSVIRNHSTEKDDSRKCFYYRILRPIPQTNKTILRIILNRLNIWTKAVLAEEQADFPHWAKCWSNMD